MASLVSQWSQWRLEPWRRWLANGLGASGGSSHDITCWPVEAIDMSQLDLGPCLDIFLAWDWISSHDLPSRPTDSSTPLAWSLVPAHSLRLAPMQPIPVASDRGLAPGRAKARALLPATMRFIVCRDACSQSAQHRSPHPIFLSCHPFAGSAVSRNNLNLRVLLRRLI
jgi:hypothetical protein